MFDLETVLHNVSNGKMTIEKARGLIEKHFKEVKSPRKFKMKESSSSGVNSIKQSLKSSEGIKSAIDKIKKSVGVDELLKLCSSVVGTISHNIPHIEKFQSGFLPIGFSANISGIDSKLSIFRSLNVSTDSIIQENVVIGSQWFGVDISQNAHIEKNKFTAVQFSETTIVRSDFCRSNLNLSRFNNVTFQEARFDSNKISRSSLSDVSLTEGDFTENLISKADFFEVVMNASRLSKLIFTQTDFKDCEFDACDIQGIEFENCIFNECTFTNVHVVLKSPQKISGKNFIGKNVSGCQSFEEFLDALS